VRCLTSQSCPVPKASRFIAERRRNEHGCPSPPMAKGTSRICLTSPVRHAPPHDVTVVAAPVVFVVGTGHDLVSVPAAEVAVPVDGQPGGISTVASSMMFQSNAASISPYTRVGGGSDAERTRAGADHGEGITGAV